MRKPQFARKLETIEKRLKAADTQLRRRRARREAQKFCRALWKHLDQSYPLIDEKGHERHKKKRPTCPICNAPMKSWVNLARHCVFKHRLPYYKMPANTMYTYVKCWCGLEFQVFSPANTGTRDNFGGFARHLAYYRGRLREHVLLGTMRNIGGKEDT